MRVSTPKSLQALHLIREQMTRDYQGLSTREFVERTRQEVDALVKKRKLRLRQVLPPSETAAR